jgi:hypothetical protein
MNWTSRKNNNRQYSGNIHLEVDIEQEYEQ